MLAPIDITIHAVSVGYISLIMIKTISIIETKEAMMNDEQNRNTAGGIARR